MSETTKLAIFVTGSGTNCENIIRYFSDKPEVEIPIVVSSRSDAYALVRAEQLGVPTAVITRQQFVDEPRLVIHTVRGCDYIILAGFLPKIPTYLIDQFPNRRKQSSWLLGQPGNIFCMDPEIFHILKKIMYF